MIVTFPRALQRKATACSLRLENVQAVVFEQTGDVSVLHGDRELDAEVIEGVRDRP